MTIVKPLALSACFAVMLCAGIAPDAPLKLGFVREAGAGLVVAPVRRTAVVTTAGRRLVIGECERRRGGERECLPRPAPVRPLRRPRRRRPRRRVHHRSGR